MRRAWPRTPGLPGGARPSTAKPADPSLAGPPSPARAIARLRYISARALPGQTERSSPMRMSQPGPSGQINAAPWRRWLLPLAAVGFLVLLTLSWDTAAGPPLSYTRFVADVGAGMVRAVTVGPAGQVTGSLAGGQSFTTTIPVALGGNGLTADLAAHHVQVTATAGTPSSLLSVLIGLLPLLLIGGVLYFVIRGARRQAGGLGGLGRPGGAAGLTKAN